MRPSGDPGGREDRRPGHAGGTRTTARRRGEDRGCVRTFPDATREQVPGIVAELVAAGDRVYEVRLLASTLEDAYLEAVGAA